MKSRLKKEIYELAGLDQLKETLSPVLFDMRAYEIGIIFGIINRTGSTLMTFFFFTLNRGFLSFRLSITYN